MKHFALAFTALLIASPAAAQSAAESTGVNSALGISPTTADFVRQATSSDMFEIKSSELALQKGDEKTKTFATQMIEAHKKTSEELKAAVQSAQIKVDVPTDLDETHKTMIGKLTELQGAEFNEQYHEDQEDAHEDAVSLFERYAEGGEDKTLKEWAGKTLPALREHLKMADAMDD